MSRAIGTRQRELLNRFMWRGALVAFDFDGTLAPIVERPLDAAMRPGTRSRLCRLAAMVPVAVITGRSLLDARLRLRDVPLARIIGNHGLEGFGEVPAQLVERVAQWRRALEPFLHEPDGLLLEDKGCSLSLHYRRCADPRAARETLWRVASSLPGARLFDGKRVLNIVPAEAANKGEALQRLCAELGRPCAIYTGDDLTDEDAFASFDAAPVLGIRIGARAGSRAEFALGDQAAIDGLLDALLDASAPAEIQPMPNLRR